MQKKKKMSVVLEKQALHKFNHIAYSFIPVSASVHAHNFRT